MRVEDTGALSPSFRLKSGATRSFEIKFLVDSARAQEIVDWAKSWLAVDPNVDTALDGAYEIHTLYLDTPDFDVYRRTESFRRRKFRARRYGRSAIVHLEQKTRSGDRVSKRRTPIPPSAFPVLTSRSAEGLDGDWFRQRVLERGLVPAVRISYLRAAFVGADGEAAFRLTVDDRLDAAPETRFLLDSAAGGVRLLATERVLELKFQHAMPVRFKELVARFGLSPASFSKYRLAVEALGLARAGAGGS
jgi:hypothetical protein